MPQTQVVCLESTLGRRYHLFIPSEYFQKVPVNAIEKLKTGCYIVISRVLK